MYMPASMTSPETKLTYARVVHYILDERENRIESKL